MKQILIYTQSAIEARKGIEAPIELKTKGVLGDDDNAFCLEGSTGDMLSFRKKTLKGYKFSCNSVGTSAVH